MRYLTLSIILFLLSFKSYGASYDLNDKPSLINLPPDIQKLIIAKVIVDNLEETTKLLKVSRDIRNITSAVLKQRIPLKTLRAAFIYLHNNRDRWIASSIDAARKDIEPDHLLEILEVEKALFAELLIQKESIIGNDPVEWKKHALASLLSYTAALIYANNAAWGAAYKAAGGTSINIASVVAESYVYGAAKGATKSNAYKAAYDAVYNAAGGPAEDTARCAAYDAAKKAANSTTKNVANNAARYAVKNLSNHNICSVAYRIAETQAWIQTLDPSLNTFEKAYDQAYSHLENVSEESLGEWFSSKENFKSKLNEYFVNYHWCIHPSKELNDRPKEFLKHIKDHLDRMIPKMFPSN